MAFNYYESAARQGIQGAQFALGSMYHRGINYSRKDDKIIEKEQNIIQAIYWYIKSKKADAPPYAKAFVRSHLKFDPPSIVASLTEDKVQEELLLIFSSLPNLWKGCTSHRVGLCRQSVESYLKAPQNCMILASYVSDELKEKLKQERATKPKHIPLPLQYHRIDDKDFITFDDFDKKTENLCSSLAGMAIEAEQMEDDMRYFRAALTMLNRPLTEGPCDIRVVDGFTLHTPIRDRYISYGTQFCENNLSNDEENHKTITQIIEKTKQVIFAKGLKGQKKFLEENPMYKE